MNLHIDDLNRYAELLVAERERIVSNLEDLQAELEPRSSMLVGAVAQVEEVAAETTLRDQEKSIEAHEQALLEEIDAALLRIEDGVFGICAVGGEPIPSDRLDVLPWAANCVEHERAHGIAAPKKSNCDECKSCKCGESG